MAFCYYHSDIEAPFYCQKDDNYMCEKCAKCYTPRVYCQYRKSCLVYFLMKEKEEKKKAVSEI